MTQRRKIRESALKALFYMDMRRMFTVEALRLYHRCFPPRKQTVEFFEKIVKGVMRNRPQIDRVVSRFSNNWKISRMSCVDRNVMRIAVYEMFYCEDIPYKVSINEAIDIGKAYGTGESGAFINGILDRIHIALDQKEIQPESEEMDFRQEDRIPDAVTPKPSDNDRKKVEFQRVRGRPGVVRRSAPASKYRFPEE